MLDYVGEETSLEGKRRELSAKLSEGRQVIAALSERQAAIGRKIEEALEGMQRLQDQLTAIETVINIVGGREIAFQPPRPTAPMLEVVTTVQVEPADLPRPLPFRPVAYLKCIGDGHDWVNSRSTPGAITCRRCRTRKGV